MSFFSKIGDIGKAIGGALSNPSALVSLGSSALSGAADYLGAREQNRAARANSREQMAFQERMSNTAHQREVADLRAAGLNPILSANSGASSPSGSSAPVVNELSGAVSSALQARRLRADIERMEEQNDLTRYQTIQAQRTGDLLSAQRRKVDLETYQQGITNQILTDTMPFSIRAAQAGASQAEAISQLTNLQIQGAKNANAFETSLANLDPRTRGMIGIARDFLGLGNSAKALIHK